MVATDKPNEETTMKIWLLPLLLPLALVPLYKSDRVPYYEPVPGVRVFESRDGMAMVVITPDPFSVDHGRDRAWRAEMHVRGERRSILHEAFFHSATLSRRTVTFSNTRQGYEVQIREQRAPESDLPNQVRRWRFQGEDVREIIVPNEIRLVIR